MQMKTAQDVITSRTDRVTTNPHHNKQRDERFQSLMAARVNITIGETAPVCVVQSKLTNIGAKYTHISLYCSAFRKVS